MDLTIRNGTVASASETTRCDIGIDGEKIVAIAEKLPPGKRDIDAKGRYVLPGGIDSHCHIEQLSGMGIMSADDFYSGTVSAAFGGTTTIIPFAAQHRGTSVTATVADYHERARTNRPRQRLSDAEHHPAIHNHAEGWRNCEHDLPLERPERDRV